MLGHDNAQRCEPRQHRGRHGPRHPAHTDSRDLQPHVRQFRDPSQFEDAGFNADLEFIRAMIRYEIDIALFDVATARRHLIEKDPQAQYALTLFPEAEKLLRAVPLKSTQAASR